MFNFSFNFYLQIKRGPIALNSCYSSGSSGSGSVTGSVTVTEHLAVLLPSSVVTVISVAPALTAVILPLLSTVATASSDDMKVTFLLVAVDGETVAFNVSVAPTSKLVLSLFNFTPVTAIGFVLNAGTSTFSDSPFSFFLYSCLVLFLFFFFY